MKRNLIHILLAATFLLSACGGNTVQPTPTVVADTLQSTPVMDSSTATPSPPPTRTAQPTATPIPATQTVTPLPTIPTFTPTFDARTIVTVAPASPAECPKENRNLKADFKIPTANDLIFIGTENEIAEFLNSGGSVNAAIKRLRQAYFGEYRIYSLKDVTGDTIPDLAFIDFGLIPRLHILYCQNGKYNIFSTDTSAYYNLDVQISTIETVADLNANNLPEIVLLTRGCTGSGCFTVPVLEWDGKTFQEIDPYGVIQGLGDFQIQDIDHNGTKELIITGDRPGPCCEGEMTPWRYITTIYEWDGQYFSPKLTQFGQAIYRFQAVQDADREVVDGRFDKALALYQDAIFSNKLGWWSPERRTYESSPFYFATPETPEPTPVPDTTEYPKLAAYAYYRIMLLHTVRGYESDAGTVYNTLQQKFGADPNGRPYAEMATAFREAYQSTHKMYDGCAAAIQYAVEHPEILIPLGSDYHGWQSHTYVPEDVCPFR